MTDMKFLTETLADCIHEGNNDGTIEVLARMLHESGRSSIARWNVRIQKENKESKLIGFTEWDDIKDEYKEGRREQARFLLQHLDAFLSHLNRK